MGGIFQSCTSETKNNAGAVGGKSIHKAGQDIDDAALQAIKGNIGDANAAQLKQQLSLTFSLRDLPNLDTFSKTDAFIVLYALKRQGNKTLKAQVGRTECIYDNLNPDFVTQIQVDYFFEEQQSFILQAYDMDDKDSAHNLQAQEYIGQVEFQLHQIVTAIDQQLTLPIQNKARSKNGSVKIQAEEISSTSGSQNAEMQLTGTFNDSGNLFFIIWKQLSPGKYKPVYKSEFTTNQRGKQKWNLFLVETGLLCNQDPEQEIKIDVFRQEASGANKLLGTFHSSMNELQTKKTMNSKKGDLEVNSFQVRRSVNFLEYVFGGCEINLNIAIDFTLSNGPITDASSLHNRDENRNEYLQALRAVGNILQYYDSDKEIPAYGFGAKVHQQINRPSHCFALNGNIFAPECDGIEGVEQAYKNAITNVSLYGPTYFSEILNSVNGRCEASEVSNYNQSYQILMILTDGVINDLQKTIDEIVRGSNNPLSIVIVGVGDADFSTMDQLDADVTPLYSNKYKKYMSRDIVQFVPFREFQGDTFKLAKETLQEIPFQLTDFFQKRNIQPHPAKEEERKKIAAQLSLRKKVDPQKQLDYHQSMLKEQLIGKAQDMGIDTFQVQDIIEEKNIWENNMEIILDMLNNNQIHNPLKVQQQPPQYMNPMGGMQYPMGGGYQQQQMYQGQQPAYQQMNSMQPGMAGGYAQGQQFQQPPPQGQPPNYQSQQPQDSGNYAYFDPQNNQQ